MNKLGKLSIGALVVAGVAGVAIVSSDGDTWQSVKNNTIGLFLNSSNLVEDGINKFLAEAKGNKYELKEFKNQGLEEAYWQVNKVNQEKTIVDGVLVLVANGETIQIPTHSEIIKGQTQYQEKQFTFGKIITTFKLQDIRQLAGHQLDNLEDQDLTLTTYLNKDATASNIFDVGSFDIINDNIKTTLKGLELDLDLSFVSNEISDVVFDFKGSVTDLAGDLFSVKPWTYRIQNNQKKYQGNLSEIKASLESGYGALTVAPISFKGESESSPLFLGVLQGQNILGQSQITIPSIELKVANQTWGASNLQLSSALQENSEKLFNLNIKLASKIEGDWLARMIQAYSLGTINIQPTEINLDVSVNNLSADFINYLGNQNINFESESPATQKEYMTFVTTELMHHLASLHTKLDLTTKSGDVNSDLNIKLKPEAKNLNIEEIVKTQGLNDALVLPYLIMNYQGEINQDLANKLGLNFLLEREFNIAPQDKKYKVNLSLQDNKLMMNDRLIQKFK